MDTHAKFHSCCTRCGGFGVNDSSITPPWLINHIFVNLGNISLKLLEVILVPVSTLRDVANYYYYHYYYHVATVKSTRRSLSPLWTRGKKNGKSRDDCQ